MSIHRAQAKFLESSHNCSNGTRPKVETISMNLWYVNSDEWVGSAGTQLEHNIPRALCYSVRVRKKAMNPDRSARGSSELT